MQEIQSHNPERNPNQPEIKAATPDAKDAQLGFWGDAYGSFVNTFKSQSNGIIQLANKLGANIDETKPVQVDNPDSSWSAWSGSLAGQAGAMALELFGARKFGAAARLFVGKETTAAVATGTESAASKMYSGLGFGAVMGGVLTPSTDPNNFWTSRFENMISSTVSIGGTTGISLAMEAQAAKLGSGTLAATMRNGFMNNAVGGLLGGGLGDITAQALNGQGPSLTADYWKHVGKGGIEFALVGMGTHTLNLAGAKAYETMHAGTETVVPVKQTPSTDTPSPPAGVWIGDEAAESTDALFRSLRINRNLDLTDREREQFNLNRQMEFKPTTPLSMAELRGKLGPASDGGYLRQWLATNEKIKTVAEYNAALQSKAEGADVYQFRGTDIVVPKDYNALLQPVRELRSTADSDIKMLDWMTSGERDLFVNHLLKQHHIDALEDFLVRDSRSSTIGEMSQASAANGRKTFEQIWPGDLLPNELSEVNRRTPEDLRDAIGVFKAALKLKENPLATRVLPEDLPAVLERLPNQSSIKTVELLNAPNVEDALWPLTDNFIKKNYGDSFKSVGSAQLSSRTVRLFEQNQEPSLQSIVKHERTHLNHHELYGVARKWDGAYEANKYARWNDKESEAELESEKFLSPNVQEFRKAADEAPIRMSLLAQKLGNEIAISDAKNIPSVDRTEILARVDYIKKNVLPGAIETLANEGVKHGCSETQDIVKLLVSLDGGENKPAIQDALLKIASAADGLAFSSTLDAIVKTSEPDGFNRLHQIAKNAIDGDWRNYAYIDRMLDCYGPDSRIRKLKLIEWTQSESPVHIAARDHVRRLMEPGKAEENDLLNTNESDDLMAPVPPGTEMNTVERARYTLQHGDDFQKEIAAYKLSRFGDASDVPNLLKIATDAAVPASATALRSALELISNDKPTQYHHLERMALPDSPYKLAARRIIGDDDNNDSSFTYRMLMAYIDGIRNDSPGDISALLTWLPNTSPRASWAIEILKSFPNQPTLQGKSIPYAIQEFLRTLANREPELHQEITRRPEFAALSR
jgi:hypothetical protein